MDIQVYAAILLVVRLISIGFILAVIRRQWQLFSIQVDDKGIKHFRVVLFSLAVIIFVGNLVPAAIDILTITHDISRSATSVNPVSLWYTMTSAGTALLSTYLIWKLYRLSADENDITNLTAKRLREEQERKRRKRNG